MILFNSKGGLVYLLKQLFMTVFIVALVQIFIDEIVLLELAFGLLPFLIKVLFLFKWERALHWSIGHWLFAWTWFLRIGDFGASWVSHCKVRLLDGFAAWANWTSFTRVLRGSIRVTMNTLNVASFGQCLFIAFTHHIVIGNMLCHWIGPCARF